MSDVPQTIDDILDAVITYYASDQDFGGTVVEMSTVEAKGTLKAIIEAEIAAIIGEDEPYLRGRAFAASPRYAKNMAIRVENELKQVQRQRAAEAMERMFGKEAA